MTNPNALARLALETWRASGPRTTERRDALVQFFAQSYFGASATWPEPIRDLVHDAQTQVIRDTRTWEVPAAIRCTNSPRCAARGCDDCERSYGPRR